MTRTRPRYDLLALDLDGTLLDPAGRVSPANAAAVRAAREAGLCVAVCTGRGWIECRHVLRAIEQADPVITAGGSIIASPADGATIHRFPIGFPLVEESVNALVARGHAALIFKDAHAAGYDYLVVSPDGHARIDPVTQWWFRAMDVRVRVVPTLEHDEHPDHSVRVGVCASAGDITAVADELNSALAGRAVLHLYPAVVGQNTTPASVSAATAGSGVGDCGGGGGVGGGALGDANGVQILEIFDRSTTKWTAIKWSADRLGISADRIAAIGDHVNDVPMIAGAGLGIAMGNAVESVRTAASRHTLDNSADGVAHAIDRILSGQW